VGRRCWASPLEPGAPCRSQWCGRRPRRWTRLEYMIKEILTPLMLTSGWPLRSVAGYELEMLSQLRRQRSRWWRTGPLLAQPVGKWCPLGVAALSPRRGRLRGPTFGLWVSSINLMEYAAGSLPMPSSCSRRRLLPTEKCRVHLLPSGCFRPSPRRALGRCSGATCGVRSSTSPRPTCSPMSISSSASSSLRQ
jgi:hypothetical protein